jgi:endonuclease III
MRKLERITTVFTQLEKLYAGATTELVYTTPFQLLIAVAMSAQTTDKQVNAVTAKFFDRIRVPDDVCTMTEAARSRCVQGVNYAPTKAKHLYRTAHILRDQFASQIPQTEAELVTLP